MNKIFLSLLFVLSMVASVPSPIQAAKAKDDGLWTYHLAYRDAKQVVSVGSKLYTSFNGNLLCYDTEDESVIYLDRRCGLSGKGIISMGYSEAQKTLVLLYGNGNVDLIDQDGKVINIPQIKDYAEASLTVSRVTVGDVWATVSTNLGPVIIDLKKQEVRSFYNIGMAVTDGFVSNETVCITTQDAIYSGLLTDNLYDFSRWEKVYDFPANGFVPYRDGAYMFTPLIPGKTDKTAGLNHLGFRSGGANLSHISPILFKAGQTHSGRILLCGDSYIVTIDPTAPYKEANRIYIPHICESVGYTSSGRYWFTTSTGVLLQGKMIPHPDDSSVLTIDAAPAPYGDEGPLRDECYRLSVKEDGKLYVSGGRFRVNGDGDATAMILDNGHWQIFSEVIPGLPGNMKFRCIMDVIPDAFNPDGHYLATPMGLVKFENFQYDKMYGEWNSTLRGATSTGGHPNYNLVNGLAYDKAKNLWMTNSGTLNTLHTLRPDGTWLAIKADNFKDQKCAERIMFDDADRVWVSSREWSKNYGGIYCLDYHGTLDNFSDDRSLFRSNGINEDGTSFDFFNLYDFAFDTEGWLWFGSDTGVFALKDPSRWFESSIRFYQPKVARNDGTNFADYLLNGIKVSAIAVDGANRKWLGTQGSGLYLVSPDGSEILQHFNVADSPILSDNIEALAFDPSNGALYIGTDVGLCQYSTNITSSAASLDKNNIKVYPNPVRPEYHGNLYITGLTEGAQVKILSAASRLVASGTAIGGTYSWDLANAENGERVSAGVYFVYIATADGKKATTVKVAVI